MHSETFEKDYDGKALTNGDGKITVDGALANGNYVRVVEFTGSQTLVGTSPNSFTCEIGTRPDDRVVYSTKQKETAAVTESEQTGFFGAGMVVHAAELDEAGEAADTAKEQKASSKDGVDQGNYKFVYEPGDLTVNEPANDGKDDTGKSRVVEKTHEDGIYAIGQEVVFTISATNIYADARTITFTEQDGVVFGEGGNVFENVAPGATVTTTASHVITEEDAYNGYSNTVTAAFSGGDGEGGTYPSKPD